ncbi:unnamed protein product, partial [marine sediment metagenome]
FLKLIVLGSGLSPMVLALKWTCINTARKARLAGIAAALQISR